MQIARPDLPGWHGRVKKQKFFCILGLGAFDGAVCGSVTRPVKMHLRCLFHISLDEEKRGSEVLS